jgi:CubicO group peptidase (beta-lactamase class C family)
MRIATMLRCAPCLLAGPLLLGGAAGCDGPTLAQKPPPGSVPGPAAIRQAVLATLTREPIAGQLFWLDMRFSRFVFGDDEFPDVEFARPDFVRSVLGPYHLDVTFYNRDFQQVNSPPQPGRYGAVVRATFDSGVSLKRYYTLFRQPDELSDLDWWRWAGDRTTPNDAPFALPPELGVKPDVAKKHTRNLAIYVKFGFYEDLYTRPYSARLLASLYESGPDDSGGDDAYDAIARDRQWWVTLKRKLEGLDTKFPGRFEGPAAIDEAAPSVHSGTVADAGLGEGLTEELNKVYTEWAKRTGDTFSVSVVRNGVNCFDKAFGTRDGLALTKPVLSHVSSVEKVMTGVATMMLVDRNQVDLDADITHYIPSLSDLKLEKPITVRHLMTHTSGLPDLSMDELNDYEQVLRVYMPYADVARRYDFSGAGYGLVGKIIENVTGEVYPAFLKRHVLDPLGMKDTQVRGAESDAYSTAPDLARLGQLLLNKGSYGGKRLFSAASYEKMLPQRLTSILGPGTTVVRGIGLYPVNLTSPEKLSSGTAIESNRAFGFGNVVGHGAISGSVLAVDLEKKVVYSVARDNMGDGFLDLTRSDRFAVKGLKAREADVLLNRSFTARKTGASDLADFQTRATKILGSRLPQ